MLRSARKLKIAEATDLINFHSIPLCNSKYVDGLRDYYRQELDMLSGFDPNHLNGETGKEPKARSDEDMKATQNKVLHLFALRKRINGI
jgi:hypothetical protein